MKPNREAVRIAHFLGACGYIKEQEFLLRLANIETLARKLHAAKGRYHTQLAACDLFDALDLPNERPKK